MKKFLLHLYNNSIEVCVDDQGGGTIKSSLHDEVDDQAYLQRYIYEKSIDILESLVLSHACAGIEIDDPKYIEGLNTTIDAILNNLDQ